MPLPPKGSAGRPACSRVTFWVFLEHSDTPTKRFELHSGFCAPFIGFLSLCNNVLVQVINATLTLRGVTFPIIRTRPYYMKANPEEVSVRDCAPWRNYGGYVTRYAHPRTVCSRYQAIVTTLLSNVLRCWWNTNSYVIHAFSRTKTHGWNSVKYTQPNG